ncbi:MAG: FAD-binding oxidoreductase [Gemmatimonadales bacterium]|nr:FAD-binding oxidoreductase [Gemmatimonadales bacterium]
MTTAGIVVIGGGVIGASVACHLAAAGERDVVVVDRAGGPAAGSTGRATGGFRAQYATAINVRLSLLSREKLVRFGDDVGADPGYEPAGYLWLAKNEAELDVLRSGQAVQHAEGLDEACMVAADDVAELNPAIATDGVAGGAFCPTDGFIRPLQIMDGYHTAAARMGVRYMWDTAVTAVTRAADGRITSVETSRGSIATGGVVNAAGAWAAVVARMAGVELPVTPLRRQVACTVPSDVLPRTMPMTIFAGDGYHLRVRDDRVLLLWPNAGAADPFSTEVDDAWLSTIRKMTDARVPALRDVAIDRSACWAGLYEVSPDKHAILGAAATCENLFLVNGASGHGVMHAPALGQLLAEIVCHGRAMSMDVSALSPGRFAEGRLNPVSELL